MAAAETASPLDLCSEYSESFNLQLGIASIFIVAAISAGGFLLPSFAGKRKDASSTEFAITGDALVAHYILFTVRVLLLQQHASVLCVMHTVTVLYASWATALAYRATFV